MSETKLLTADKALAKMDQVTWEQNHEAELGTASPQVIHDAADVGQNAQALASNDDGLAWLALDLLTIDPKFQARVKIDADHVERLREPIKAGKPRHGDPVTIYKVANEGSHDYFVTDGHHWIEALKLEGKKKVKARILSGTRENAFRSAIGSNGTHGLPRTTADKERAVRLCLEDADVGKGSTKAIAKACRVSESLAARVRTEWEDKNGANAERVGDDGKKRKATQPRKPSADKAAFDAVEDIVMARTPEKAAEKAGKFRSKKNLVDQFGQEVPERLAEAFLAQDRVRGIVAALRNLQAGVEGLKGNYLTNGGEPFHELKVAAELLDGSEFGCVCPGCDGDGCADCSTHRKHAGFLTAAQVKANREYIEKEIAEKLSQEDESGS